MARAWSDGSFGHAMVWWLALGGLGAVAWAGLRPWLAGWQDGGWAIARSLALLAAAVPVWIAAHLAPAFTPAFVWTTVPLLAVLAWLLRRLARLAPGPVDAAGWAWAELRFLAPFAFYLLLRGFNGDLVGLEKPMDLAFLNAALASPSMPPPDPWFSGQPINYYYFGQYLAAFVCRLTQTPSRFGYNLMLATLFAATFQLCWALAAELATGIDRRVRPLAAAAAACWVCMGGNLHAFLYALVRPLLVDRGMATAPAQPFLLSDPTRFVGYDPPAPDKLITEFPAYAFYVGDLHAHLLNLPNVLLFLCTALAWLRASEADRHQAARAWLAATGALLGLFAASNTWDAAMYGGVLLVLFGCRRHSRRAPGHLLADGAIAAAAAIGVAGWFLVGFRSPAGGIGLSHSHTPVWQWLILYGEQAGLALIGVLLLRRHLASPEGAMLLALTICGIGFALVPELVYLKDIYGSEFYRANTAFKFGFQAFVTLTICACVALAHLVQLMQGRGRTIVATVVMLEILLLPPLSYAWLVAGASLGHWRQRPWTLDGGRHLARQPEDAAMIAWLAARRAPGDVLVEAVGESYSPAARIATHTAIPAVLGWPVHELLWRRSDPEIDMRRAAIASLYAAHDPAAIRTIAAGYGARWIVVGGIERSLYPGLDESALRSAGEVAFQTGRSFVIDLRAK